MNDGGKAIEPISSSKCYKFVLHRFLCSSKWGIWWLSLPFISFNWKSTRNTPTYYSGGIVQGILYGRYECVCVFVCNPIQSRTLHCLHQRNPLLTTLSMLSPALCSFISLKVAEVMSLCIGRGPKFSIWNITHIYVSYVILCCLWTIERTNVISLDGFFSFLFC
jgi:hypothetical protein